MGGRHLFGEVQLKLWIETAHQCLVVAGGAVCGDKIRTFQTEDQFFAILSSGPPDGAGEPTVVTQIADSAASLLRQGIGVEEVVESLLAALPAGMHVPFSVFQVLEGRRAHVVECDAPPLFLARGGRLVLLPVLEDVAHGRLVRQCQFLLQDGDHLAMVSEGYIHARGWSRRWGWRDIAVSVRRWTETGCDAEQLLGALIRMYRRLAEGGTEGHVADVSVVAMHVRPKRTITVWTGPPVDPGQDQQVLERLMDEQDKRVICGDTTAQIAARLLGTELEMESRPGDGWREVPPVSRMAGVDLVTEGVVTLGKARERMVGVDRVRDLPRGEDGATCLARMLLAADVIHFIVGLALNPGVSRVMGSDVSNVGPPRLPLVEELIHDLKTKGKLVSTEYV